MNYQPKITIRTSSEKISISGFKSQIAGLEKVIAEQQSIIDRQSIELIQLKEHLSSVYKTDWTSSFIDRINSHLRECGVWLGGETYKPEEALQRLDMICRYFNQFRPELWE